jgi:pyruvate/2-oxoglutarate dehydrogenase complex dihydrolipoamide acyltransferase (E2) component
MRRPIVVPDLGCPNLVLSVWYVKPGESVFSGDRVVEVLLGSATFEISAPSCGTLETQCAGPDEPLSPGQVVGYLDVSNAACGLAPGE